MKRIYRNDVSFETKQKQSVAHKNKKHSTATKQRISRSLQKYWASLPTKPSENNTSTTEKIYGKK
jgi:hypothetical protein